MFVLMKRFIFGRMNMGFDFSELSVGVFFFKRLRKGNVTVKHRNTSRQFLTDLGPVGFGDE